jgi:MFS family permease
MLSRQAIGIAMALVVLLFVTLDRPFCRAVWTDGAAFWRGTARYSAVAIGVALVWIGLLDDWLQIVTEPYRLAQKWESKREIYQPIDGTIRAISIILLALALVGIAMLFARHVGGYGLQVGTLLIGVLLWIPLFIMNGRINSTLLQGAESSDTAVEVIGLGLFWLLRMGLVVGTVLATLLPVTMAIALVVTFLLDLFHMRQPPITHEADGFFAELGNRASERHDVPLKYLWKPHRRPL